ncbi:hypothetical protein M569_09095 [Genlisea aurea]|uniref:TLDc domain-containing protein n=1 Tax=Genlisea aurea TaxID=192259 RepID=S8CFI1_9LAMI|nr:hypothetical protein M569_09095 [Genlisea aurea]
MGNSSSSSSDADDPRFAAAARAFTPKELEDLRSLFTSLAARSQIDGKNYVSPEALKAYTGIDGELGDRVFDLTLQNPTDRRLTFRDLVIAKGTYERGNSEDIENFIYRVVDISNKGTITRLPDIVLVLTSIFNHVFHRAAMPEILRAFTDSANFTDDSLSEEEFRRWCNRIPAVRKFLGGNLLIPSSDPVPKLQYNMDDDHQVLLRKEYAWHIAGAMSINELQEWKLLYHSSVHGLSFNTFLANIQNDGPTVLIIKDDEGYVYGGYASQPWEKHSDFYGDMKSFLFQLYPKASIFRPTGSNRNLQWCGVNFSSDAIPNGIGFGGRVHHFGLFVSAQFDKGHTFPCTTFANPCLSKDTRIRPKVIECWGVMMHQNRAEGGVKGTVLERFKEDRHMLNMVGLANSSD